MESERKLFISEEDELRRIREKKLREFMESKGRKLEMNAGPIHITDSSFNEVMNKHRLVLVDFWASWCNPCRALAPVIDELAEEYSGKVAVGKLNVDDNPATAERFQVFSIPTVVVMKNGKEVDRIVGCVPKTHIENAIRKHLEK